MTNIEFRTVLEAAVSGDRKALDTLLSLYMPLINRLSSYAGQLDEGLQAVHPAPYRSAYFRISYLESGSGILPEPFKFFF